MYIVVGLPGSGKTTWAREFCRKNNLDLIDDPKGLITDLVEQHYQEVLISDPNLCLYRNFQAAKILFPKAKWVFFEPNSEICWKNVESRKSKEPWKKISKGFFDRLSQAYSDNYNKMSDGVEVVQILKCYNSLETIEP
jgi:hypothetical protein